MLRNRLYYCIKPLLPWAVRIGIRRWFALRKRSSVSDVWPILPGSERPPQGWRGWPEGKKFAFVLTHDVEGPEGLEKVKPLAELEMNMGFRSSFNFIPEGPYSVPLSLRAWLLENGFEVAVHDLKHDGKLFASQTAFPAKARQINGHLREWGAVGFRAGFMLRELDWLHDLAIAYDASTFDTDPFEPQPEHAGTIFPFWVARPDVRSRTSPPPAAAASPPASATPPPDSAVRPSLQAVSPDGYVELPYTLPQDSTLFLVLRAESPEIWLRKLDWVTSCGGMALVNVHPDYLQFSGELPKSTTYPISHYRTLLEYVRNGYASDCSLEQSSCWHVLPREMAAFVRRQQPRFENRRPLRVCMVAHSNYRADNRIIRYAETLADRGDCVEVLGLRERPDRPRSEKMCGVDVIGLQDRFRKDERGPTDHLLKTMRFLLSSSLWITRRHLRQEYDLIHVHNIPDFLVFAAWYPRLRGAKLILDIHDIVPEFFASKFAGHAHPVILWALRFMERRSARFVHHVIIANDLWLEKYASRTGAAGKCSVFINNVNTAIFRSSLRTRSDERRIVMFPGGLQWHQGVDLAIRAFPKFLKVFPDAEFHIYGDGNMKADLQALTESLGLARAVRFFPPIPVREVAQKMADADLGVVPKRADSFGNEAYSTKIMEFMALGVPVVASSTRVDRFYFDDSVVKFFESGNVDALAAAMIEVLQNREGTRQRVARAAAYAATHSWDTRKADYLKLVDTLCASQ